MKRNSIAFVALVSLALPYAAFAHEHQVFRIGGELYDFTMGSLNEPVVVDDKTGVDVRVKKGSSGDPVTGLETSLKVELNAGGKKKILDLAPAYNDPGAYRAPFYPTVQTTYTYRLFGTVNDVPVDLSFTCNPAGHPQAEADTNEVPVSDGVVRIEKRGAFGCPVAKAALGFPEESVTLVDLAGSVTAQRESIADDAERARGLAVAALTIGLIGAVLGGAAFARSRKSSV